MAQRRRNLRIATIVYWVLLVYVFTALAWWSYMLLQQTEDIYLLKKENLSLTKAQYDQVHYEQRLNQLNHQRRRDIYKVVGEGGTFLLLIIVGAVFIYRSVRQQFRLHLQQQNFVMAVSHELKTPIAVSRLNLETLQKYQLEEEKQTKLLQATLQENLRLDTLINNILISAQLEGSSFEIEKHELDFSALVTDVCAQFQARYRIRELQTNIQNDVHIIGDGRLLKLMLSNLLENAHKYSPADKPIQVQLTAHRQATLIVADAGAGIPEAEKKNIFKKFYRVGNEHTRKTQGTGLGLYIVKRIVKDHRGTIVVKNNTPGGSKFIIQV